MPNDGQNCRMKVKFVSNICKWSHFSVAITLCNQHLPHNDALKHKLIYCLKTGLTNQLVITLDNTCPLYMTF